jgi:hypothetical protein
MSVLKAHECQKKAQFTHERVEYNVFFVRRAPPLKAPNRLKSLKLAWRFVLTSCDISQNLQMWPREKGAINKPKLIIRNNIMIINIWHPNNSKAMNKVAR